MEHNYYRIYEILEIQKGMSRVSNCSKMRCCLCLVRHSRIWNSILNEKQEWVRHSTKCSKFLNKRKISSTTKKNNFRNWRNSFSIWQIRILKFSLVEEILVKTRSRINKSEKHEIISCCSSLSLLENCVNWMVKNHENQKIHSNIQSHTICELFYYHLSLYVITTRRMKKNSQKTEEIVSSVGENWHEKIFFILLMVFIAANVRRWNRSLSEMSCRPRTTRLVMLGDETRTYPSWW